LNSTAIHVEGLSKQYRIGVREKYVNLRDKIAEAARRPWQFLRGRSRPPVSPESQEYFWALKDVSFDVPRGEVLGIIGRNGAGKSTLLKILSRITRPTEGFADIQGQVRSLLEVGTGFHPELSGRENIYLNGAILGMKRSEINVQFDDIVAFAEVEKFVDTPVKRYSSGMYLRLAFAVAAQLSSEILLVDEVLAVGDAAFQKKCIGRMSQVAQAGRTVLFVSHNMAAVRSLCSRGLLLDQGKLVASGPVESVLFRYTRALTAQDADPAARGALTDVRINGANPGVTEPGEAVQATCRLHLARPLPGFRLFCILADVNGEAMVVAPANHRTLDLSGAEGSYDVRVSFAPLWLRPGVYSLFFKLLASSVDAGEARFFSESVMLDVIGEDDPEKLLGRLTPETRWAIEPASQLVASSR